MNHRIKVKSLKFGTSFRKLKDATINFSDRITLIAGHNGIGKTTILGLVASTFGVTEKSVRSYLNSPFYANIESIVHIALDEIEVAQREPNELPEVRADVAGVDIRKRCSLTRRGMWNRARVVPRTIDKSDEDPVGPDAKIPLPTIYLGLKRLASAGEAAAPEVTDDVLSMHAEDGQLIVDFVNAVILGVNVTANITQVSIKSAKKHTAQPGYSGYDARAISLGQDSLASIATALASFNQLKRDMPDYPGGLLVIDEIDAGFHPHAIHGLVKALKSQSGKLNLQVIATTHSPTLLQAIHPDGGGAINAPDSVVYLVDTKHPRLADDQSLQAILDDMELRPDRPATKKPALAVYFEDPEGLQFFEALMPTAVRTALGAKYGVRLKPIALGVGGSNLLNLPNHDPIFAKRVLIADGDTLMPNAARQRGNSVKLPISGGATGTARSPENQIKQFLRDAIKADEGPLRDALRAFKTTNVSTDKVQAAFFSGDGAGSSAREASKGWWKTHAATLKKWGVVEQWAIVYSKEVDAFRAEFEQAVKNTAAKLRPA